MALTPITLTNLPGADRRFNIPLNAAAPYVTRSWEADTIDEDIRHSGLSGAVSVVKKRKRRTITLKNVILNRANRRIIEELRDLREAICVSPPWKDGTDTLTYLPLQKTLSDLREEKTRDEVDFERLSARFNSVTGRKTLFGDPHWEDAPRGQGINISDVINDHHEPSYELRSYLTTDAEDSGATTLIYVSPAQAVLWDNYGSAVWPAGNKAFLMISTEEETTNSFELALISAINTTTGLVTLTSTDGTAALTNTANYTYAKRCHISSALVSDCEMEDSGIGSWAGVQGTPELVEKNNTQQETGLGCLRIITDAAFEGAVQDLGDLPADTDIVVLARVKVIRGTAALTIYDGTTAVNVIMETATSASWTWMRFCGEVNRGGAGQKGIDVRFRGATGADEFLVDRIYIFQNSVDNGGMEPASGDTYDMELAVVTTSAAATTTYVGNVVTDAAAWNLANAKVGHIAKDEVTGAYGRINTVNDAGDSVTVDAWVGAPANGNACGIYNAVAPGWNEDDCEAGDYLWQDTDHHGGTYAQGVNVSAAGEGIHSAAAACADGYWFLVGANIKVSAGTVDLRAGADLTIPATAAVYTWVSGVGLMTGNRSIFFNSSGGAATWLCDDCVAVRLPGNPYDDAIYDFSEALSTTGFAVETECTPDVANTALTANAYIWSMSRRTYDAAEDVILYYNYATASFVLDCDGTTATVAKTFSAGDSVHIGCQVTGAAGSQVVRLSVKVGTAAESNNSSGAAATTPTGITRLWTGRLGSGYVNAARGSVSCIFIENAAFSNTNMTALLDAFSGADADRLALLEETHGILYEIRRGGVKVRGPAKGDEFRADIVLTELDRVGAFATRDSA